MAAMILDNNIVSIRNRFIIFCGMILLWLYLSSKFLPTKKLPMSSTEGINNSPYGLEEVSAMATNDEQIITDTSTQTTSSSSTTKRTTLPAVVFIPKPTTTTEAIPGSSDITPSFGAGGLNVTNNSTIADNTKVQDNSSSVVTYVTINDDDNAIVKTKNVWDEERNGNSDSEFLETEEEGSGHGPGVRVYEMSTPEYLEDMLNFKRVYPRYKNPINEEYLSKISHD